MTPAEKIQAAIEKLETLKAESTGPNPWIIDRDFPHIVMHPDKPGNSWDGQVVADTGTDELGLPITPADARAIVTLHRTIDAQLAILRAGLHKVKVWTNPYEWKEQDGLAPPDGWSTYLALASAILGGDRDVSSSTARSRGRIHDPLRH